VSVIAYTIPIGIRQTSAAAADQTVWSARNLSAKTILCKRIYVACAFDGTAAPSTSRYHFARFRTATPTAGATVAPIGLRARGEIVAPFAIGLTDARVLDTGLTVTSVTFDTPFAFAACPRGLTGTGVTFVFAPCTPLDLAPNDGLCIRVGVTAVIGDSLTGWAEFEEH
jgi:hypothetical protein